MRAGGSALALAAVALMALVVVGCGGDGSESDADTAAPTGVDPEQFAEFRDCMSEHGVELPQGGSPGAGPPHGPPQSGGGLSLDEDMAGAFEACRDLAPEGGLLLPPAAHP